MSRQMLLKQCQSLLLIVLLSRSRLAIVKDVVTGWRCCYRVDSRTYFWASFFNWLKECVVGRSWQQVEAAAWKIH